jgi:predicted  nucleic acid-binding Zn-ribbon protein
MNATGASTVQLGSNPDVMDLAEYASVENFMQKVFRQDKLDNVLPAAALPTSSEIDAFERTAVLIEKASKSIEALSSRCEILETEIEQERSASDEHLSHIEALQKMLLARNVAYENDVKSMTIRCEAAETRVLELERAQKVVTSRASKAESISRKLQQQVESAFGQGSPIWSVMDGVHLQQAAE